MSSSAVNHFRLKRQAHNLGRHDTSWNPFAHTFSKTRAQSRRETWNGGELEAQRGGEEDDDTTAPIRHAQTAPDGSLRASQDDNLPSTSKDIESHDDSVDPLHRTHSVMGTGTETQDSALTRRSTKRAAGAESQGQTTPPQEEKSKPTKSTRFKNVQPKEPFTVGNQIQRTILNSWINVLILAAPIGIGLNFVPGVSKIVVFVVNFIAIIPLAAMLSFATEEIALRVGETLGGLLNATFGYAPTHLLPLTPLWNPYPFLLRALSGRVCNDRPPSGRVKRIGGGTEAARGTLLLIYTVTNLRPPPIEMPSS